MPVAAYLAYALGIIPLLWLSAMALEGDRFDASWWWLAGAFGVSFLADSAALCGVRPDLVGNAFPIVQASIIGMVLMNRRAAGNLVGALMVIGLLAVQIQGAAGIDVILSTVAFGAVSIMVWPRRELLGLRDSLLMTFGVGLVAWWGYAAWPGWLSWGLYQFARACGTGLFVLASLRNNRPQPAVI